MNSKNCFIRHFANLNLTYLNSLLQLLLLLLLLTNVVAAYRAKKTRASLEYNIFILKSEFSRSPSKPGLILAWFPTFSGLGNPKCGLGNSKMWKGFYFSNIFAIKMLGPSGIELPRYVDRLKEIYRSQWLLFSRM